MMRGRLAFVAVVAIVGLAATGCHEGPSAKAGQGSLTLHFGTVEQEINKQGHMKVLWDFVDEVSTLSAGRLKIELDTEVGGGTAQAEPALIEAIQKGRYDGGWSPTRSFAQAHLPVFEALQAPFVIQSYPVEQAVVTSKLADQMLGRLKGSGLVGLGLLAGPLRRAFAVKRPLLQPSDWQGISFRVEDSPVQVETVAALGARAVVTGATGGGSAVGGGADGREFDIIQYDFDGFANADPYVTDNVALWPRTVAIIMNSQRFASLSEQQRQWLKDAAGRAVHQSATDPFDEDPATQRLCLTGVRFADVSSQQLADLRTAVAPVYAQLRSDPSTAADLAAIQAMVAAHPAASSPAVPAGCRGTAPRAASVDTTLKTAPNIPDGTYRVYNSASDFERFGAGAAHAADNAGNATLTLTHGQYIVRIRFDGDSGETLVEAGTFKGTIDTIVFIPDLGLIRELGGCVAGCSPLQTPYSLGYTYSGGSLTFTVGAGLTDPISLGTSTSHPWLRIG